MHGSYKKFQMIYPRIPENEDLSVKSSIEKALTCLTTIALENPLMMDTANDTIDEALSMASDYELIEEYIDWSSCDEFAMEKEASRQDIKLSWYIRKFNGSYVWTWNMMREAIRHEAMILFLMNKYSMTHLLVSALRLYRKYVTTNKWDMKKMEKAPTLMTGDVIKNWCVEADNYIKANQEILLDGTYEHGNYLIAPVTRTKTGDNIYTKKKKTTIKRDMTKELLLKMFDPLNHSKKECQLIFTEKTGYQRETFNKLCKEFGIKFKESRGRKKAMWHMYMADEDWYALTAKQIKEKLLRECHEFERKEIEALSMNTIAVTKYKKMKEIGLEARSTEAMPRIIADNPVVSDNRKMDFPIDTNLSFSADDELTDFDLSMPTGIGKI